jgi:hypothetical protein
VLQHWIKNNKSPGFSPKKMKHYGIFKDMDTSRLDHEEPETLSHSGNSPEDI